MSTTNSLPEDGFGRQFIITREFHAPRELVFRAWTDPLHLSQWWGPKGFTNPVSQWDARPGGKIYDVMRGPNGVDYPMGGEFREVVAPERLVFTSGAMDEKGKLLFEFLHTVTFVERKDKTTLTIRSRVVKTTAGAGKYIGGFDAGMTQSLERLAEHLATKSQPLVIERTINAPAAQVWSALTRKDEMKRWYFDLSEFKPEMGFEFQFTAQSEGVKYVHHCRIVEVIPGKKLVHSWRYEGYEGDSQVTFELFAEGNQTRLRLTHEGLESFPKIPAFARTNFMKGWTQIVGSSLKEFLENPFADREIVLSRVFEAPRELVFEAFTNPEHLPQWWGPRGFTITTHVLDVRPGGVWRFVMHGQDGRNYENKIVYREIVRPTRMVYAHSGENQDEPGQFVTTVTFDEQDGKTKLTMRALFRSAAERDEAFKKHDAIQGGKQTLERLGEHLPRMVTATRPD